jgi:tetratricopeptide (TPR) repeat protein
MIALLEDARRGLADHVGPVSARVLARLAAAMRDQFDRQPRDELSRRAIALARGFDDPSTLALALSARGWALIGPDGPDEQLAIADELTTVARAAGDKEREVEGLQLRAIVLLGLGELGKCHEAFGTARDVAEQLRQPAQRWLARSVHATLALLEGRFSEAGALIESSLRLGRRSQPFDAIGFARVQLFALHREDGTLREMEQDILRTVEAYPTRPLFRCLLALLFAELGDHDQALSVFEPLAAAGFADLPLNNDFLLSVAVLVEVARSLSDADRSVQLYERLLPYSGMIVDTVELSSGAVDRYLGLAAMTTGDLENAERHLREALDQNTRIGAVPWKALTQRDLAELLLTRGDPGDHAAAVSLLRNALGAAERLGMASSAARIRADLSLDGATAASAAEVAAPTGTAGDGLFRREGEYWSVSFDGSAFRLKDAKGLRYLSHLLQHPGREFHVLDLVAVCEAGTPARSPLRATWADDLTSERAGDVGPLLDERAKSSYRARLSDLEDDLNEATEWADSDRAAAIRAEMQFLSDELASAVGLGGRDRRAGSEAERARVNVTRAVRSIFGRVRAQSAPLADHLEVTVRTGTFCSYSPDPRSPITWRK